MSEGQRGAIKEQLINKITIIAQTSKEQKTTTYSIKIYNLHKKYQKTIYLLILCFKLIAVSIKIYKNV